MLIISITSNAQDIVPLNKGEVAPFTGALVPPDRLNDMRKTDEELRITKKQIVQYKDLQIVNAQRMEYYKGTVKDYQEELSEERTKSTIKSAGYFLLGALLTGLATKIAIESAK
jgi:hypothetical protein